MFNGNSGDLLLKEVIRKEAHIERLGKLDGLFDEVTIKILLNDGSKDVLLFISAIEENITLYIYYRNHY